MTLIASSGCVPRWTWSGLCLIRQQTLPATNEIPASPFDRKPALTFSLGDCEMIADHVLSEVAGIGVLA